MPVLYRCPSGDDHVVCARLHVDQSVDGLPSTVRHLSAEHYAEAKSGDYCSAFSSGNNITAAQLYRWNPVLGQSGEDCNTSFQANN